MAKTLLEITDAVMSFGHKAVLDIERFSLAAGERVGLIGENGAGKTTLLKLIAGELTPDRGTVRTFAPVTFIHQTDERGHVRVDDLHTASLFGVVPAADTLSGGERTRRRIAAALSANAALLLADEPTSDLDQAGVRLLEKALAEYRGALMLVSHDRALLRRVCTDIVELEDGHLTRYPGGYDAYREEKARRRAFEQDEYEHYRGEQKRLRAAIQGKREHASQVLKLPGRMGNSEARLHKRSATQVEQKLHATRKALTSRLDHLEVKQRPRDEPGIRMRLGAAGAPVSKTALEARELTLRVPARTLLSGAAFKLPTGSRTALLGDNGCGKTTLLTRILAGDPRIKLAPGVRIASFGQDHASDVDMDKSVLDNAMAGAAQPQDVVRTVLARLGIRGDAVFKRAGALSGGERAKLKIARILVGEANLLILDEPTNHLDIYAMEALESMLAEYAGTLLVVSHDRAFVQAVATRLVMFEGDALNTYEGDMRAYEAECEQAASRDEDAAQRLAADHRLALDMRLAELAGRIAKPRKGDDVVKLRDMYEQLAQQKRL